jgi:O-acetylserine/cysteine efflux transporter
MRLPHLVLILLIVVIWGFNFVVIDVALAAVSPLTLCFARFFVVSIPAVFFIKRPAVPFKKVMLYGLVLFALQFALLFTSMKVGMPASLASLLLQLHVFFTILLAVLFLGEKPSYWQVLGALIAFAGIMIVGLHIGGSVTWLGFILMLASAFAWAMGSFISKKIGKVNMISLVVWGNLVAWPPILLLTCMTEGTANVLHSIQQLSWLSIGAILYIAYLSTVFGFAAWNWLLHEYPVATIVPFTLLVPIVGMLCSALVLGEALEPWKIFAGVLVIAGLCVNLLAPRLFKRALAMTVSI